MLRSRGFVALPVAGLLVALAGCGDRQPPPDPSVKDPQALYDTHCVRCHARAGETGGPKYGGSKGPDISHVGSSKEMTADWLFDYIKDPRNPKTNRKDARMMPAFGDTLTDEQIRILADWLAAKK